MKTRTTKKFVVAVLLIVIVISYIYLSTKDFDLEFLVDKETSDLNIENIYLEGTIVKLPLNIYPLKGFLSIGDDVYNLTNYKKIGNNKMTSKDIYQMEFMEPVKSDYFSGKIRFVGDLMDNKSNEIFVTIDITNKHTGETSGQKINAYLISD